MFEQLDLFDGAARKVKSPKEKKKINWENSFQKWSNEQGQDESGPVGICGYSSICDYCSDNTYGRPCVRALNRMCKEKGIKIDYDDKDFLKIWDLS